MGRTATIGLAIVLTLGLAAGATQAEKKKTKKFKTEPDIELIDLSPGGSELSGDIHSRKPKCEKGRTVTVVYTGPDLGHDNPFGTAITDRTGDWAISSEDVENGPFVAEVERKRVGKGEKKIVCKAGVSPETSVEL